MARHADLPDTAAGLHDLLVEVDVGGRFRRVEGRVVFGFGRYRGVPLDEVACRDPAYLRWMLGRDFLSDGGTWSRRALDLA